MRVMSVNNKTMAKYETCCRTPFPYGSFISSEKLSSFLRYLNFCPDFFGHIEKRLDKKTKVNLKIYDAKDWQTNNYNTLK